MSRSKEAPHDRVIDARQLAEIVPFSQMHVRRLERAGQFPQRIHLGRKKIGWVLSEVTAWLEGKKAERTLATTRTVSPGDRSDRVQSHKNQPVK